MFSKLAVRPGGLQGASLKAGRNGGRGVQRQAFGGALGAERPKLAGLVLDEQPDLLMVQPGPFDQP